MKYYFPGVCGNGTAFGFPIQCYFNNDPQGRYICCDSQGCNGFSSPGDLMPKCANGTGFVPPGIDGTTAPLGKRIWVR